MEKHTELRILAETAAKLGDDSYCGIWLKEQLPFIEDSIRSDFFPSSDWRASVAAVKAMVEDAKNEAAQIIEKAKQDAEKIRNDANSYGNRVKDQTAGFLRKMLREINA